MDHDIYSLVTKKMTMLTTVVYPESIWYRRARRALYWIDEYTWGESGFENHLWERIAVEEVFLSQTSK